MEQIAAYLKEEIAVSAWKNCMMVMVTDEGEEELSLGAYLVEKLEKFYPIYGFSETMTEYDTQIESDFTEELLAEQGQEDNKSLEETKETKQNKTEEKEEKKTGKNKKKKEKKGSDRDGVQQCGGENPGDFQREAE